MPNQLHILTDTTLQTRWTHAQLAQMAFDGGADVVQFREKRMKPEEMQHAIKEMLAFIRKPSQKLIVNDDVQIAAAVGADGAHIGREDLSPWDSRQILGVKAFIGATVHSLEELVALGDAPINYIGVGPVFGTQSKSLALPPMGLKRLEEICQKSPWPVIAIGSVTLQNVAEVIAAGAHGVAVLGVFCLAEDPTDVARAFKKILG
jgi:thiamine-phosphate pyrophosphorylase